MFDKTPPAIRRDRLAERKARITAELVEVKRKIGEAKGNAFVGGRGIPNQEWSDLLNREASIKSEITRIEVGIAQANREASEHRWRTETLAQNYVLSIVRNAIALRDDDSDANWRRMEASLDRLRDECPAYFELNGLHATAALRTERA